MENPELVQLLVDCATGERISTPLNEAQLANLEAVRAEVVAQNEAQETARTDREAAIDSVLQSPAIAGDPGLQSALALLLGVAPPPRATQLPVLPEEA